MKTAGKSLYHMLVDEYGRERIAPVPLQEYGDGEYFPLLHGVNPLEYQFTITPDALAGYDVLMGHYDWHVVERLPEWHVMTMVRYPPHQIYSLYRYAQRIPYMAPLHPLAQELGFNEWAHSEEGQRFLNSQTRFLSGHGVEDVEIALRNLRDPRLTFGLVERFSESVALFNRAFDWDLREVHINADDAHQGGDYDVDEIEALQADDMRLWRRACELFDSQ